MCVWEGGESKGGRGRNKSREWDICTMKAVGRMMPTHKRGK